KHAAAESICVFPPTVRRGPEAQKQNYIEIDPRSETLDTRAPALVVRSLEAAERDAAEKAQQKKSKERETIQSTKLYRLFQRMGDVWESEEEDEEDPTPVQGQTARRPGDVRPVVASAAPGRQSGNKRSLAFCLPTAGGGDGPGRRATLSSATLAGLETEKGNRSPR
ncbi:hypothetical protein CSUI_003098, partial [Cystoisospora suis]